MRIPSHFSSLATIAVLLAAAGISPAAAADYTVAIRNMAFGPVPPGLHVGDTITWRNDDIFRHSATARAGAFDVDLPPKASAQTVVKTAGTIDFFCKFHPGMKGTLNVSP